jgi:hypothetical protein
MPVRLRVCINVKFLPKRYYLRDNIGQKFNYFSLQRSDLRHKEVRGGNMRPSKSGWFWYFTDKDGWEPVKVYGKNGFRLAKRLSGNIQSGIMLGCLPGIWGKELEQPQGRPSFADYRFRN